MLFRSTSCSPTPTPPPPPRRRCSCLAQRLARERGDGGRSTGCCPGRSPRVPPGPGRRGGVTLGIAQGQLNEAYRLGGRKLDLATEPRTRFALRLPSHTPLAGRSNGSTLRPPIEVRQRMVDGGHMPSTRMATCCSPTPSPPPRQRCSRWTPRLARERGAGSRWRIERGAKRGRTALGVPSAIEPPRSEPVGLVLPAQAEALGYAPPCGPAL